MYIISSIWEFIKGLMCGFHFHTTKKEHHTDYDGINKRGSDDLIEELSFGFREK